MIEVAFNAGELTESQALNVLQDVSLLVGRIFKEHLNHPLPTFVNLVTIFRREQHEVGSPNIILISLGLQRYFHAAISAQKTKASLTWRLSLECDNALAIGPDAKLEFKTLRATELADIFARIAQELSVKYPEYEVHYHNEPARLYHTYRQGKTTDKQKAAKKPS